jgi:hypothetical protein
MKNPISHLTRDDVLAAIGLQPQRGFVDLVLPAMGLFGGGMLLGAGLGMLLAPRSGVEIRGALRDRVRALRHRSRRAHAWDPELRADLDAMSTDFDGPAGAPSSTTPTAPLESPVP